MLERRAEPPSASASSVSPQIPPPQGPHSSFLPDRHGSAPSYAATVAQTSSRGPISSHGPAETSGSPPGSAASYAAVAVSDPAEARTSGMFGSLFFVDDDSPVSVENHFSRTYSETAASELGLAHAMRRPGSDRHLQVRPYLGTGCLHQRRRHHPSHRARQHPGCLRCRRRRTRRRHHRASPHPPGSIMMQHQSPTLTRRRSVPRRRSTIARASELHCSHCSTAGHPRRRP